VNAFDQCAHLLSAARSPAPEAPREAYCAAARRAFDAAHAELRSLECNLIALEAELLGRSALIDLDRKAKDNG